VSQPNRTVGPSGIRTLLPSPFNRGHQPSDRQRDPQDREIELSFWESVRSSDNAALIQAYLDKDSVIDLIGRVTRLSVETVRITEEMRVAAR
jgi:hypothetical protein